jgi:proteasome regulatory subunit
LKSDKELDNVMYSYTSENSGLEEENRVLRETISQLKSELDRLKIPPLMVCEIIELIGENAIIKVPNGNQFFVNISTDIKTLEAGDSVLVDQKNLNILRKIGKESTFNVEKFVIIEKPKLKWEDIGGLDEQINEIKEVIELPLKNAELFKKIGITPPKGV